MKFSRVVLGLLSFAFAFSGLAITNEWTKPTSGYWEEPYWSLGVAPSTDHESIAFRNSGWKALAIGTNTTANFPASLTLNNLIIDGPTNSANQLLLNWAGLNVPLVVRSNLTIGTNGSLASHSSALRAANFELRGVATFSDLATGTFGGIVLRSGGELNLNDASLVSSNLAFVYGVVTQTAGRAVISNIATENDWNSFGSSFGLSNAYFLSNGILLSENISLGRYDLVTLKDCSVFQSGGVHSNVSMTVWGGQRHFQTIHHLGHYSLSGGLLVSEETRVYAGTMEQSGGTNFTKELVISGGGFYTLNGGQLVTSNTAVGAVDCLRYGFFQNGGSHTVRSRLRLDPNVTYSLSGGTLSAPIIEVDTGASLGLSGGSVSNSAMVVLRGAIGVGSLPQQLGKLQVLELTGAVCGSEANAPASLGVGFSNAVVLRFADSRDVPWSGTLRIYNWSTNDSGRGPDRIFFGSTSQALTSDQLSRVVFINPSGLPSDYAATLTATGELVPAGVHDYDYVVTDGTVTITRYTGPGGNITVPGTIANLPVTAIADWAFNPDFNHIWSLTSVTLPNTVTNIGEGAFHYCKGLTNINLGNGVIRIGDRAFADCDNLSVITIPASVREIGQHIFESSHNVLAVNVHLDNPLFSSIDGVLFNKSQTRLIQFPPGKAGTYAVPQTVRSIEDVAFYACYSLSNVILTASVTNIGAGAFEFCVGLTNITIPEGLRTIGDFAFFHCITLTNITLPDSLTSVGARLFEQSALVRAEIGRGITRFGGWHFFAYCENLAGVYFRGDAPEVISDFQNSDPTIYYLPGTIGWGATFAGRPTAPWFLPKPVILDFGSAFGFRTNRFGFVISWATNASIVVERSTNVTNSGWSAVSTGPLTSGSFYFRDPQGTDYPNCFYRLRVP